MSTDPPDPPDAAWLANLGTYAGIDLSDTKPAYDRAVRAARKAAPIEVGYRLTDVGNGQRFAADHKDLVRYCHDWAAWLLWNGRCWDRDCQAKVETLAKETVRGIYAEAAEAADSDARRRLAAWAAKSESRDRVGGMLWAARSEDGIPVTAAALDSDPWAFNVSNGTIDLQTGALRPHRRGDLFTKIVQVDYDPAAQAPRWASFLEEITNGDQGLERFLWLAAGYSLTGSTREHCLFLLHGIGRNGKSTVLSFLRAITGDYIRATAAETLMLKRSGGIPNDIARLKGARIVTSVETEDGRRLAESLIKEATGGDVISARFLHAEWFDFRPEFKIWLASNHKPCIRGTDPAIWARIHLVPFAVSFEGREDRTLDATLLGELPGILAWAVEGCLAWQREGLHPPESVKAATASYRAEEDIVARFLSEETERDPGADTTAKDLYSAFGGWCQRNRERPTSKTALGRRLTDLGLTQERGGNGIRVWCGIRLGEPTPRLGPAF
jgi:putative DNA primase/helicase